MIFPTFLVSSYLFSGLATTYARPIASYALYSRADKAVSVKQVDNSFLRGALFSRVAYCSSDVVQNSTCGAPCDALGDVEVFLTGGDGGAIPRFFVTHDKTANAIVVAHEGTEKDNILSVINDLEATLVAPNSTFFPYTAGSDVLVHTGFQETFERTADQILSAVQDALKQTGATKIISTGHSLGAAVATFDSLMFNQLIPDVPVEAALFGLPRTGNQDWANFIDSQVGNGFAFQFMTNQDDPVPRVPPTFLDYQHSSGEVHIVDVNNAGQVTNVTTCSGQEDPNCIDGDSAFDVSIANHLGPYFNDISFGRKNCPL